MNLLAMYNVPCYFSLILAERFQYRNVVSIIFFHWGNTIYSNSYLLIYQINAAEALLGGTGAILLLRGTPRAPYGVLFNILLGILTDPSSFTPSFEIPISFCLSLNGIDSPFLTGSARGQ